LANFNKEYCTRDERIHGFTGASPFNLLAVVVQPADVAVLHSKLSGNPVPWLRVERMVDGMFDATISDIQREAGDETTLTIGVEQMAIAAHAVHAEHGGIYTLDINDTWYCQHCYCWHVSIDWAALLDWEAPLFMQILMLGYYAEGLRPLASRVRAAAPVERLDGELALGSYLDHVYENRGY
jgi:hypothetical protein